MKTRPAHVLYPTSFDPCRLGRQVKKFFCLCLLPEGGLHRPADRSLLHLPVSRQGSTKITCSPIHEELHQALLIYSFSSNNQLLIILPSPGGPWE
jgi:hypothetical protein